MSGATIAALENAINAVSDALVNQIAAERALIAKADQDLKSGAILVARGDVRGVVAGIGLAALEAQRRAAGETMPDLEAIRQRKYRAQERLSKLEQLRPILGALGNGFGAALPHPASDQDLLF